VSELDLCSTTLSVLTNIHGLEEVFVNGESLELTLEMKKSSEALITPFAFWDVRAWQTGRETDVFEHLPHARQFTDLSSLFILWSVH
jgi:hypothetical protein